MHSYARSASPGAVTVVALVLLAGLPALADDADTAILLYDQGRYTEALTIFEKLDLDGAMDGPMLYRMSFCYAAIRDSVGQRQTLERAVTTLEAEVETAETLEPAFYLANALSNLGRRADARAVAKRVTDPFDSGERDGLDDPVERFRLAKLYADQGRQEPAATWYRQALEGLETAPDTHPVYIRWSRRYLGNAALADENYEVAEKEFLALEPNGLIEQADWDRVAVIRFRAADYRGAQEAWREAERADPPNANRARYCWRLAAMAHDLGALPAASPDGRPWPHLPRKELEALMKENGDRVKEIRESVENESPTDERRAELESEIEAIRPVFVAAGLEYAARNYPIRETAFFGGYAPLIFQPQAWKLPVVEGE